MSEEERAPLLDPAAAASKSNASTSSAADSGETTPLLSTADTPRYDGEQDEPGQEDAASVRSATKKKKSRRWPSVIAMIILGLLVVAIIILAFVVPDAVEEYAKEAAVLEPTNLSLESITANGVRARVQANFRLDGSRVANEHVRRIGRAATWITSQLGTDETKLTVRLPDYDSLLLGTAVIPPLVVNLRDGYTTAFDFVADLAPGDVEGIRTITNEWLEGRVDWLRLKGSADVSLKCGFIPLGIHTITQTEIFEGQSLYRSFATVYLGQKSFA